MLPHLSMKSRALIGLALLLANAQSAWAQTYLSSPNGPTSFQSNPVINFASATPLVMLNMSRESTMFSRAYNDYSALISGNTTIQTTYSDQVEYAGYFDSEKCYTYTSDVFQPVGPVTGYVNTVTPPSNHYCSGNWSGNFLNWATMTRIDEIRDLLYGGLRVPALDTATGTVLERAYFPPDGHAWAKYYNGSDIASLAPLSASTASLTGTVKTAATPATNSCWGGSNNCATLTLTNSTLTSSSGVQIGDQLCLTSAAATASAPCVLAGQGVAPTVGGVTQSKFIIGRVASFTGSTTINLEIPVISGIPSYASATTGTWYVTDLSNTGVTLCNLTQTGYGTSSNSQNIAVTPATGAVAPPLVRVAPGDRRLWGANESYQCLWSEQKSGLGNGYFAISGSNGNLAYFSGLPSSDENPSQATGLGSGYTGNGYKGEYVVRVAACVTGKIVNENCEVYPLNSVTSTNQKPIGLLQQYGEQGKIKFGLITGSYDKNISGGVVRANIPGPTINGTNSISAEVDPNTGIFLTPTTTGIIAALNNIKIYGYNYEGGNGNDGYGDGDGCPYQEAGIVHSGASSIQVNEGNCSNWGNPISEAYLEAIRYFGGAGLSGGDQPTAVFKNTGGTRDTALNLPQPTWADPLNTQNYCASLNVLTFNGAVPAYEDTSSGNSSYYNSFSNLTLTNVPATGVSATGIAGWTDLVGAGEGINGNKWFIGSIVGSTSTSDGQCTAKTVGTLSKASGICPDGPALAGSYMMAGVAYAAHVNRIRSDFNSTVSALTATDPATGKYVDTTSLKVNSYGIQLASNTPNIVVPVPGNASASNVTIIPTYSASWGSGRIIDFRIVQPNSAASCPSGTAAGTTCGSYYVNWEDSQQGGDYDQDLWGVISYAITSSTIKVTTASIGASSAGGQGFGFTIGGTTQDGPHFFSGAYGYNYADPYSGIPHCSNCTTPSAPVSYTFTINTSATASQSLQDPLWYAAKWGGFVDSQQDPNGGPSINASGDCPTSNPNCKWDSVNNATGASGGDGIPDNYYYATNPSQLTNALNRAFNQIVAKVSSGTSAAVQAAAGEGSGAAYQAFYEASRTEASSPFRTVQWLGSLQALFVGSDGHFYENDGSVSNACCTGNTPISFTVDANNQTVFQPLDPGSNFAPLGGTIPLYQLKPIWNARKILAAATAPTTQRTYTTSDTTSRYMFTWVDGNHNGKVDSSEVLGFCYGGSNCIGTSTQEYLNLTSNTTTAATKEAQNIINWVRGSDGPFTDASGNTVTFRQRTMTYSPSDPASQTQRLGDIINSTPTVVGTPSFSYDLLYGDASYGQYRGYYCDRRQVVMVGANDGILHAFNAGFYDLQNQSFTTQPDTNTQACHNGGSGPGSSRNGYQLGEEMWAYVPQNLLGQVTWLTSPSYKHLYYVDGAPRIFDVNLSSALPSRCSGCSNWGTIAVVPFRLGGGQLTVNDGTQSPVATLGTYHSGYIVMDVTNPEQAPVLLGEITLPANQLATSSPTVVPIRTGSASSGYTYNWYLVVGSGPDLRSTVASDQTASVYVYDLNAIGGYDSSGVTVPKASFSLGATNASNSFVGDIVAADWQLNFQSEGVYFGTQQTTYSGSPATVTNVFNGALFKLATHPDNGAVTTSTGSWALKTMYVLPAGQPVTSRPTLGLDASATPYVFFGTGRVFASSDLTSTSGQSIYALKDLTETSSPSNCGGACLPISSSTLTNVTSAVVTSAGAVSGVTGVSTFSGLQALLQTNCVSGGPSACSDGWYYKLAVPTGANTTLGSERVVTNQSLFDGQLFTASFTPDSSLCGGSGQSTLYAQYYQTGTASPTAPIFGGGSGVIPIASSLGQGLASTPSLVVQPPVGTGTTPNNSALKAYIQTSNGQVTVLNLLQVPNGEVSWREVRNQ